MLARIAFGPSSRPRTPAPFHWLAAGLAVWLIGGCANLDGSPGGTGGVTGSGGASNTGGIPGMQSGTGGGVTTGSGGISPVGSGGAPASSGGAPSTGGQGARSGGAPGSGGLSATGGQSATGGRSSGGTGGGVATGGAIGSGGNPGTAGTSGGTKVDLKGKKALFIVDNPASLSAGDMMLKDIMSVSRDMVVTLGDTVTANPDVASMNVIVASSAASASEFPALYKTATVPMMVFGNGAYQALGFINASSGKGSASTPVMLSIVDDTTPLAAALTAGTAFAAIGTARSTSVYWGNPGGSAIKVAAIMGAPTELFAFAYEKGAAMATGAAPARRVALGFKTDVIGDLSIEAFKLMNAALEWTAGAPP